jgi:hypothetical protein
MKVFVVENVECEISVNGEKLTGTAKGQDILKLYDFDKCHCLGEQQKYEVW